MTKQWQIDYLRDGVTRLTTRIMGCREDAHRKATADRLWLAKEWRGAFIVASVRPVVFR